ncbi:MAG TPA: tetratricopeptide repeat protein [Anaerolineales bacterium]|nr:tetratricopeptide repeat protein [Anaerolineales bacterium]
MLRRAARIFFIIILLLLAMFVPVIVSGYSELDRATTATDYAESAQHYRSAAERLPWRGDLYELSGHSYYYAKDYVQANDAYEAAYRNNSLSPEGWVAWGDVIYLNGDTARATEIWEQARQQKDPSKQLYSRLAEIYQSNGEFSKAAESLQSYVSAYPGDASAHYRLGLLLTLTDAERASSELVSASQLDPEFDSAVETLRAALKMISQTASISARFVITGRGLGLVSEWQLARAAFESAVEADAKNAEAWAWLGEAKQQAGLPDAGLAELDQALDLDPRSPTIRGLRGLYFQRVGNFRQALTEFEAAASLDPENPAWFVSLGEAHSKNGDLIRSLQAYQNATTLAPEDAEYWRLLAIFCAQNNVNVRDVGLPAAQKAVLLTPEESTSLDVLGWSLTLEARYEEARRMLDRALELDQNNASAHLHMGLLGLQMNDRTTAYDHLMQARDLGNQEAEIVLKQYFP